MRILVLRGGALGDFVVTLPALRLLRERWPRARIELVGNASAAKLGLGRGYLDAVHAQGDARWSRLGSDAAHALTRHEPLAQWLVEFDLVLSLWPDADGAIARDFRLLGFSSAGPKLFLSHPAQPRVSPAAAHYCAALRPLGLGADVFAARIHPTDADRAAANARLPDDAQPLIAWHAGSGSGSKNWPVERWLQVLALLVPGPATNPARLIAVLGGADAGLQQLRRWRAALPKDTTLLDGDPPEVLAAVFERCRLFFGHDTGPAHVAAAVGCPCLLIFGPTDPALWAPPGEHVHVVRKGHSITDTAVADVIAVLGQSIE